MEINVLHDIPVKRDVGEIDSQNRNQHRHPKTDMKPNPWNRVKNHSEKPLDASLNLVCSPSSPVNKGEDGKDGDSDMWFSSGCDQPDECLNRY